MLIRGTLPEGTGIPHRGPLHDLLEAERRRPDAVLLRCADGVEWTVAEVGRRARACAATLRDHGVRPGDRVAVFSPNDLQVVAWWLGISMAGAVEVPVNAHLRGPLLRNVLQDAEPTLIVAGPESRATVEALGDVDVPIVDLLPAAPDLDVTSVEIAQPRPADLSTVIYTSGTTGPSKGVMLPFGYFSNYGALMNRLYGFEDADVVFAALTFFHVDARIFVAAALQAGFVLAVPLQFSASRWWQQVADTGATFICGVGAMFEAVASHGPPDPAVVRRVRGGFGAPLTKLVYEFFEDELGIPMCEAYGQTEADCPIYSTVDRRRRGAAGWPCAGHDVAIVDPEGRQLGPGEIGEIVFRPGYPNMIALGYWRRDDATVEASRDLWWHSGDSGHFDEDGFLYFDGRLTDSLRRRGENVSAWELEATVCQAPGVAHAAAVPVADEIGGEDEIKLFVVLADGAEFDPDALFAYCAENLPRFAVPRFIEPIAEEELVRSAGTGVIQKHRLPKRHGPSAVDRLAVPASPTPSRHHA